MLNKGKSKEKNRIIYLRNSNREMPNFTNLIDAQDQRIYHDIFCSILYTRILIKNFNQT